jgi:hypothetical protein
LITQNLATLDITEARTTATFLAKEWIELTYNMRDSNKAKSLPWDCVLNPNLSADDFGYYDENAVCLRSFASWTEDNNILQVWFASGDYSYIAVQKRGENFTELWSGNRLYYTTGNIAGTELFRYSNIPVEDVEPTVFSRYISFGVVKEWDKVLPPNKILKVESHVLYMKGSTTWEVVLESFIWNY